MSSTSPAARSLAALRADGWTVAVVEKWNPHARVRQDLYGIGDLLAIRPDETLLVQVTTADHVSHRVAKIADAEHVAAVREAGWRIEVHGWRYDRKTRRWVCRIVDVS